MNAECFVDTNVLVYAVAHEAGDGAKNKRTKNILPDYIGHVKSLAAAERKKSRLPRRSTRRSFREFRAA